MKTKQKSEMIYLSPKIVQYAKSLVGEPARELFEAVGELARKYEDFPGLGARWQFNEETGLIDGSNLARLVLANEVLGENVERTLTYDEGMELDKKGKLTNGVYRDFGIGVFSQEGYNEGLAKKLIEEVERRGWKLPILAHPSSLRFDEGSYKFREDDSLVVTGEKATEDLKRFNYVGNSGVRRLGRNYDGGWCASWSDLPGSDADGLVDFVSGEATRDTFF